MYRVEVEFRPGEWTPMKSRYRDRLTARSWVPFVKAYWKRFRVRVRKEKVKK